MDFAAGYGCVAAQPLALIAGRRAFEEPERCGVEPARPGGGEGVCENPGRGGR